MHVPLLSNGSISAMLPLGEFILAVQNNEPEQLLCHREHISTAKDNKQMRTKR